MEGNKRPLSDLHFHSSSMADSLAQISRPEPELPTLQEKKIGNKGLKKTILTPGVSWQTPHPGDEVEVFYSGKVKDGPLLDPTGEKATPFKFKLGQHEVINGLDEGIGTMKKGEKAIFTIPPSLGYGEAGYPPHIPPDSTLIFDVEMISWTSIRDITGDGGVMKKIIIEGEGWATPRDGDEVSVQFEARLENGVLVSKSKENTDFFVGDGSLCPAIHKAVKTMRKGEKAELTVRFSYGYGVYDSGRFGTTNLNPNVTIYLELMSCRSVVDVTGDKKILKKILAPGQGFDNPSEGSIVKVQYIGRLENGSVFDKKGSDEEPFEYTCLQEEVNEGIDRAIMTMKKGEKAQVTMDHIYGDLKLNSDDTKIIYDIQLLDFTKEKPFWKMETHEKEEARWKCTIQSREILASLKEALKYLEFNHSFTDEEKSLAKNLEASCYLNNAACKLKLEEYNEVSRLCSKVLEQDPSNVKALFRRSQAYMKTSELEKAEADIKRALEIDPNNRDIKVEYRVLKDKQKENDYHQAKFFSTILSKMG
ncbi:hypothetical protein V2J09_014420 [Rumex salicifolius]